MKKAITRRQLMELTAAFAASSAVADNVQAQAYPNRTIRLIAPFPAGGGTDSAARISAARWWERWGQRVVVDTGPGDAEAIGRKAIEMAKQGDMAAIRLCMARLAPAPKGEPVAFELPPLEKPADSVAAAA